MSRPPLTDEQKKRLPAVKESLVADYERYRQSKMILDSIQAWWELVPDCRVLRWAIIGQTVALSNACTCDLHIVINSIELAVEFKNGLGGQSAIDDLIDEAKRMIVADHIDEIGNGQVRPLGRDYMPIIVVHPREANRAEASLVSEFGEVPCPIWISGIYVQAHLTQVTLNHFRGAYRESFATHMSGPYSLEQWFTTQGMSISPGRLLTVSSKFFIINDSDNECYQIEQVLWFMLRFTRSKRVSLDQEVDEGEFFQYIDEMGLLRQDIHKLRIAMSKARDFGFLEINDSLLRWKVGPPSDGELLGDFAMDIVARRRILREDRAERQMQRASRFEATSEDPPRNTQLTLL
ncbi:hypothetical protein IT575_11130 [bacterium]|nr:hypothetical protein [bacterium]